MASRATAASPITLRDVLLCGAASYAAAYAADDWIAGASIPVLWFIWKFLGNQGGVAVLAAALTFQWMQVTVGIWYFAVTGRRLDTMELSDYRPMVLIGLGCVAAVGVGVYAGIAFMNRWRHRPARSGDELVIPVTWRTLVVCYVVTTAAQSGMLWLAYQVPGLTQPIFALRFARLAVLFIIARRLSRPVVQWHLIAAVTAFEIVLGLSGFFAGFREPLVMIAVAFYEAFDPRKVSHWVASSVMAALMFILAVLWMNVRGEYRASFANEEFAESRQAQMDRIGALATSWWRQSHDAAEADLVVDRLWVVYYPALAISRVPSALPHTNGSLLLAALQHVSNPRLFFPTKAELQSDSEMVRKYSGVWVAGPEGGTSIAFGYAAEAYIDFGVPLMFVPIVVYGILMGFAFEFLAGRIAYDELRAGLLTVVYWMSLYLFERSWVRTLGLAGTLLVYLGGIALLLDYYLARLARPIAPESGSPGTPHVESAGPGGR